MLIGGTVYFLVAYFVYGKFLKRTFGIDRNLPCPSVTDKDGIDYVPTQAPVLFGHHFASIAGAGPIVGPVLAAKFGWLPAILWILLGCVFVGAMHDFAAMFLSVRNHGRSIAYVIEKELGYACRQLFLLFCLFTLLLVVTVFTLMVADSFIGTPAVATASIIFICMAPIFGVLIKDRNLSLGEGSLIFVPILFLAVWVGTLFPLDLGSLISGLSVGMERGIWVVALLYYAFVASVIPVWFLLQPRDYLNSFLLYSMILIALLGILFSHKTLELPAVMGDAPLVPGLIPLLFVTIACGACSGFHALVASGTSAKQVAREQDIFPISYGGMLLEGVLAIIAVCSVAYLSGDQFKALAAGGATPQIMFAEGLGHFAESIGISFEVGKNFIALAISAFLLTSLDTATRLARFLWQELLMPSMAVQEARQTDAANSEGGSVLNSLRNVFGNRWLASFCVVVIAGMLALSGDGMQIWPVFGASNQLLASLTLLAVTLFMLRKKKPFLFAMLPMFFMFFITVWALGLMIVQNWGKNMTLCIISILLLVLAGALGVFAIAKFKAHRK